MKNKKIKSLLILGLAITPMLTVKASSLSCADASVYDVIASGGAANNSNGLSKETGRPFTSNDFGLIPFGGYQDPLRHYNSHVSGNYDIKTYCLEPVLKSPYNDSTHSGINTCVERIDPSNESLGPQKQGYYTAMAAAYKKLRDMGHNTKSNDDRNIGEIVFRWIGAHYGQMSGNKKFNTSNFNINGAVYPSIASTALHMYSNPYASGWGAYSEYQVCLEAYEYAIQAGDMIVSGKSYKDVVDAGYIWSEEYEFDVSSTTENDKEKVTISVRSTKAIAMVFWDQFTMSCKNPTVSCNLLSHERIENGGTFVLEVTKASNYNGQDYGITLHTKIYDADSASSNMLIVRQGGEQQRMLIVNDDGIISSITSSGSELPPGGGDFDIPTHIGKNSCTCDEIDGIYTYVKETDGVETNRYTWKEGENPPEGIDTSTCPSSCSPKGKESCTCSNGTYTYHPEVGSEIKWDVGKPRPMFVPDDVTCPPSESCYGGNGGELCVCKDEEEGLYEYLKYQNKLVIEHLTWRKIDPGSKEKVDKYNCPPCGDTTGNKCKKTNESSTGYFCSDGSECSEEIFLKDPREDSRGCGDIVCTKSDASSTGYFCRDGSECSEEIFKKHPNENQIGCGDKYPSRTCEKPSNSNGNKWYCNDGNECNEKDYYKDCECGSLPPESEEYKKFCMNCNPTITVPGGCKNLSDDDPSKGTMGDINTVSTECNKEVDQIKYCVLGKDDLLGNTFEATEELKDNPYCKVWCKEDYDFKLPTAKLTQSGGYFTLATTLNGKRSCYTSSATDPTKEIDSVKFEEDLKAAQNAIIDAYNEFNKWKVAYEIDDEKAKKSETCTKCNGNTCGPDGDSCCTVTNTITKYEYKWNYTKYDYNGKASSASDSKTSGECYDTNGTSQNSYFYEEMKKAKKDLIDKINALNDIIMKYNSCSGVVTNSVKDSLEEELCEKTDDQGNCTESTTYKVHDASSTSTTSWENTMLWGTSDEYSPIIDFVYNEDYLNNMNGKFTEVSGNMKTDKNEFCSGEINDKYECTVATTSEINTKDLEYITCNEGGCYKTTSKISTAKWITKTKERTATYQIDKSFSTSTPYGVVKFQSEACSGNDCLWSRLPEGALPVQLNRNTGLFPFKFTFRNIGQFNNANTTGRIIGKNTNDASVITEYNKLPESEKCTKENVSPTTDGSYVCYYLNNCDDCDFECDPDDPNHCEFGCNGDSCDMVCDNCIFDGGEAVYSYRTVSLNSLFPNERKVGSNWNIENQKAQITQNAIDELGEEIYTTPQYSYTLTPGNLKEIREYNDDAGSYVNSKFAGKENGESGKDALYCETKTFNGIEYKINCRSRFLDMLENEKGYATVNSRITSNNSNYNKIVGDPFELYTDAAENCEDGECLTIGIGPSWRIRSGN